MKQQNAVLDKSYFFALRIIKLYRFLQEKKEFHLSVQLLKSGTSIGANVEEAMGGSSRRDFKAKLSIAYKEAKEAHYWIRLLRDSNYIPEKLARSFVNDSEELIRILAAILNTLKAS